MTRSVDILPEDSRSERVLEIHAGRKHDPVDHPQHYLKGGIETIDFIEAKNLGFHLGNVVKYITRWELKGKVEDLKKARWYLDRFIQNNEDRGA